MNISDDLSVISGITNISQISRTNSSISNISEWRSTYRDTNRSFATDCQRTDSRKFSLATKLHKGLASCEESVCDYAILKLIYRCLEEIISSETDLIENNTIKKLKELIRIHKLKKYLYLPTNSTDVKEELTLLGIQDLPTYDFSYEEQLAIKSCLETKIHEKIHNFIKIYENYNGSSKEVTKYNDSILCSRFQEKSELNNINLKNNIEEICLEYKKDLQYCLKLLKQCSDLRYKVNEKYTKDAENLLLKAEIAEMKAIITKLSATIRMYKETPITIEAFKNVNECLERQISNVSEEISEKTELKKAYDALSGTVYDQILKKYTELCHVIKKKRNLLEKLL